MTIHLQAASQAERPPGADSLSLFVGSYPYGMRDFDVLDPDGNRLVFGSSDRSSAEPEA